jgi:hypothetical protein
VLQRYDAPAVDNVAAPNGHTIAVIDPMLRSRAIKGFRDHSLLAISLKFDHLLGNRVKSNLAEHFEDCSASQTSSGACHNARPCICNPHNAG